MTSRPFHHGNLRAVLLDQAEQTLREHGIDALSLRELARKPVSVMAHPPGVTSSTGSPSWTRSPSGASTASPTKWKR